MNNLKYFLILNPGSQGGKSKNKIEKILASFRKKNIQFEYDLTKELSDAYKLSAKANHEKYDIIVAVGGDGTINGVLNGFFDNSGNRISQAIMAIIYTGTSPDFCKSYNIPLRLDEALQTIFTNHSRKIKIGKIILCRENMFDSEQQTIKNIPENLLETKYFGCCVNIGLGAEVARMANSGIRKYLGDFAGTFFSLIKAIFKYKPSDFTVSIDEQNQKIEKLYNLSVGITKFIASGIKVNHDIEEQEKKFYNLVVTNLSLLKIPFVLSQIYSGKKIQNNQQINLNYCSKISVENNINSQMEFDGDPYGYLPCEIQLANDTLDVICSENN